MSNAILILAFFLCTALAVFLAVGGVHHKPEPAAPQAIPQTVQAEPEPLRVETPIDEGRGAHAILARMNRARALAYPGQGAPKGITYHVKRQPSRELTVVVRTRDEPATDRVVAWFDENDGMGAWDKRNRLQYGYA